MKFRGNRRTSDFSRFPKRVRIRRTSLTFLEQQMSTEERQVAFFKKCIKEGKLRFCER